MTYLIFTSTRVPARAFARLFPSRREAILSVLGPLGLLVLMVSWVVGVIVGFTLLQWAIGTDLNAPGRVHLGFGDDLYFSATTFLT